MKHWHLEDAEATANIIEGQQPIEKIKGDDLESGVEQTMTSFSKHGFKGKFDPETGKGVVAYRGVSMNISVGGENLYIDLPEAYAKESPPDNAIKALVAFINEILDVGGFKKSSFHEDVDVRGLYHQMIQLYQSSKPEDHKKAVELAKQIKAAGCKDKSRMKDVDHILKSSIRESNDVCESDLSYSQWKTKFPQDRNDLGFAAIYFDKMQDPFILDAKQDGWFRKREGKAKGYGLMIRKLKITSKNLKDWGGSGSIVPISITFLPNSSDSDDPNQYEKAKGYLYYHKSIDPEDVLSYVNQHMQKWIP